jgi:uncharacterized protein (TIGR03382 family)
VDWLQANWYLAIPWLLAIGAWLFARRRRAARPLLAGVISFVIGCAIVVAIDLTQSL